MVEVNTVITRIIDLLIPIYIASYLVCKIQPNDMLTMLILLLCFIKWWMTFMYSSCNSLTLATQQQTLMRLYLQRNYWLSDHTIQLHVGNTYIARGQINFVFVVWLVLLLGQTCFYTHDDKFRFCYIMCRAR